MRNIMTEKLNEPTTDESYTEIWIGKSNNNQATSELEIDNDKDIKQVETSDKQTEQAQKVETKEPKPDLTAEYEQLKKQLSDAKTWGHKKNVAYVNAKKKMTEFLSKLKEDSLINEEDVGFALKAFNENITDDDIQENKKENYYANIKANLDKEFAVLKKYNKDPELEEKYQSFFGFFPLLPQDEQEKIVNYLNEESPDVVIDHIITTGTDIYETVYKEATKNGGIIPFIKSLHAKIEKLEKRNKQLESEVDTTEGIVHNRSINSKVLNLANSNKEESYVDIWRRG